jgi:hypothetical protein
MARSYRANARPPSFGGCRLGRRRAPALFDAEGEIDDGAEEGDQGNKAPGGFFFDAAEVFAGDVDDGHAGEQPEQYAAQNDHHG